MTFHFAHMAPPGAASALAQTPPACTHAPRSGLAARWVRCPLTQRLVMHWDRPTIPAQHVSLPPAPHPAPQLPAPHPAAPSPLDLRAA